MQEIKPKYWNDEMIYEPECCGMCYGGIGWEAAVPKPSLLVNLLPTGFSNAGMWPGGLQEQQSTASHEMIRTGITLLSLWPLKTQGLFNEESCGF